jgi:hypothetical protein
MASAAKDPVKVFSVFFSLANCHLVPLEQRQQRSCIEEVYE